jgi:hypothetical protein
MSKDLETIKFELLTACENGAIDISEWVQRFPEHRNELLDFWLWARPRAQRDRAGPDDISSLSIAAIREESLHRACLAVSLGSEWLRPLAVEVEIDKIARDVRQLRKQPAANVPSNRRPFRRAVVYAWVIEQLAEVRTRVSRLATQKTTYLLENFLLLELFDTHKQKPLGPYDHVARYADAEPIAEGKGWIEVDGSTMCVGAKASEFHQYAGRYLRSTKLASTLTRWLGKLTDDQLETLATVHWTATRLVTSNKPPTAASVRESMERDSSWSSKLQRRNFDQEQIAAALAALIALGLLART